MGLDIVELVMALEEQFGVELKDEELVAATTPGEIIDIIYGKVGVADPSTCMTQRGFYALRRALIKCCGRQRSEITPDASLESLIPPLNRPADWQRLGAELIVGPSDSPPDRARLSDWPGLRRPKWMEVAILTTAVVAGFTTWAVWRSGWFGFGLGVAMAIAGYGFTARWRKEFPERTTTVGELTMRLVGIAPRVFKPQGRQWRREDVAQLVRQITIEQLGIKPEDYREDARFIEDLGAG